MGVTTWLLRDCTGNASRSEKPKLVQPQRGAGPAPRRERWTTLWYDMYVSWLNVGRWKGGSLQKMPLCVINTIVYPSRSRRHKRSGHWLVVMMTDNETFRCCVGTMEIAGFILRVWNKFPNGARGWVVHFEPCDQWKSSIVGPWTFSALIGAKMYSLYVPSGTIVSKSIFHCLRPSRWDWSGSAYHRYLILITQYH